MAKLEAVRALKGASPSACRGVLRASWGTEKWETNRFTRRSSRFIHFCRGDVWYHLSLQAAGMDYRVSLRDHLRGRVRRSLAASKRTGKPEPSPRRDGSFRRRKPQRPVSPAAAIRALEGFGRVPAGGGEAVLAAGDVMRPLAAEASHRDEVAALHLNLQTHR